MTGGIISQFAGSGADSPVGSIGATLTSSVIKQAFNLFIDTIGNFFVAETTGTIRKIASGTSSFTWMAGE